MVGSEQVMGVVALLDLAEAVDRLPRKRLGHLQALLGEVKVAPGVVRLERRLECAEPGASRRHRFRHRNEADPKGEEGAGQGREYASDLRRPGEGTATMPQLDREQLRAGPRPDRFQ